MALPLAGEARDFLLDANNDLVVTTDLQFVRGVDAVAQGCRVAVQMYAGEWFLDLDFGIPYWERILGFPPAIAIKAATIAFRDMLSRVDGVLQVVKLNVQYLATRTLQVTWQVRTAAGDTPVDTLAISGGA